MSIVFFCIIDVLPVIGESNRGYSLCRYIFFILSVISKTTCHIEVIPYVDTFCIMILMATKKRSDQI